MQSAGGPIVIAQVAISLLSAVLFVRVGRQPLPRPRPRSRPPPYTHAHSTSRPAAVGGCGHPLDHHPVSWADILDQYLP